MFHLHDVFVVTVTKAITILSAKVSNITDISNFYLEINGNKVTR